MTDHVFVVSEWLPKPGKEQILWDQFKILIEDLSRKEPGCVRAHVTKQIKHPGSPSVSKYKIVLLQEYLNVKAFDEHCAADYVKNFFKDFIEDEESSIVEDWQCRLFSEAE